MLKGLEIEHARRYPVALPPQTLGWPWGRRFPQDNETSFAGAAPAGGNYAVEVGATEGTADYALTLTITGEPTERPSTPPSSDPPNGPGGGTIEFPSGEESATVEGDLGEGVVDTWTLQAAAGQSIEVLVYTDERNAVFSIYAPNGDRLAENVPTWTGELPADGGYVIEVTSTGGEAVVIT